VLICDQQRFDIGAASCVKKNVKVLVVRSEKPLPAGVDKWEDVLPLGDKHPGADISPDDDATILYTSPERCSVNASCHHFVDYGIFCTQHHFPNVGNKTERR
jgi:hypothetical protein